MILIIKITQESQEQRTRREREGRSKRGGIRTAGCEDVDLAMLQKQVKQICRTVAIGKAVLDLKSEAFVCLVAQMV